MFVMASDESAPANATESIEDETMYKLVKTEEQLKLTTVERDQLLDKVQKQERELSALRELLSCIPAELKEEEEGENNLTAQLRKENHELRTALSKAGEMIKDKSAICSRHEKHNNALVHQVNSLREVVQLTKDLLKIRNLEVESLQADVENMQTKIDEERQRHNLVISKMEVAMNLNQDLKREYELQLKLFQDLKVQYERKMSLVDEGRCDVYVDAQEELPDS